MLRNNKPIINLSHDFNSYINLKGKFYWWFDGKKETIQFNTYETLAFDFESVKFCKKIFFWDQGVCRSKPYNRVILVDKNIKNSNKFNIFLFKISWLIMYKILWIN